jgi:hypothetical protein
VQVCELCLTRLFILYKYMNIVQGLQRLTPQIYTVVIVPDARVPLISANIVILSTARPFTDQPYPGHSQVSGLCQFVLNNLRLSQFC